MVADERAHALQQRPYVERGRFAAVRHICLRESALLQFECERLHVAANDFNGCSENSATVAKSAAHLVRDADDEDAGAIDGLAAVVKRESYLQRASALAHETSRRRRRRPCTFDTTYDGM